MRPREEKEPVSNTHLMLESRLEPRSPRSSESSVISPHHTAPSVVPCPREERGTREGTNSIAHIDLPAVC